MFIVFEVSSHYIALAALEFSVQVDQISLKVVAILWPVPSECWE